MRLSTDPARDDTRSLAVLEAARAAGITLFDTADAYALDDTEIGHNERLLARVLSGAFVVTKGGLVRPDGAWVPNGRARHLAAAARASQGRLGTIDLYLLHAIDPRVPLATSVRALAKLRDEGIVRAIGLSNVGLHQLEEALAIAPIEGVEVELSPARLDPVRGGLVAACKERSIRVLAHRPLGGPAGVKRLVRDERVQELAKAVGASPCELALAWLVRFGVIPIPGATRVETVHGIARANELVLADDIAAALDAHWLHIGDAPRTSVSGGEIVMIVGMPAAGKSTLAARFSDHVRLNRDDRGGSLTDLARALDRELAAGNTRIVLDNTYGTRASRAPVIAIGRRHGIPVRCVIAATTLEQAQANACSRMLALHGRLLEPTELAREKLISPNAQFRYRRSYEPPRADEGFAAIEEVAFVPEPVRRSAAAPDGAASEDRRGKRSTTTGKPALIVELDGIVWRKRDGALLAGARDALAAWHAAGYALAGTTWQTPPDRLLADLALPIAIARCVHPAGPPVCWCRKPLPGLALWLAHEHGFDLARSVHVGKGPADRGFALRAGMRYFDIADGWPMPANVASA